MQKTPDIKAIISPLLALVAGILVSKGFLESNDQAGFVAYATEAAGGVLGLVAIFAHMKHTQAQAQTQATREAVALDLEPGSTPEDVTKFINGFDVGSFLKQIGRQAGKIATERETIEIVNTLPAVGGVAGAILRQAREAKERAAREEASRTKVSADPTIDVRVSNLEEIVESVCGRLVALEVK